LILLPFAGEGIPFNPTLHPTHDVQKHRQRTSPATPAVLV
jgi:hypothetical protein